MYLRDASKDSLSERHPVTTNFPEEKASAVDRLVFDFMRMAQAANRLGWNSNEYDWAKRSRFNGFPQVNVATTLLTHGTGTGSSVGAAGLGVAAELMPVMSCVKGNFICQVLRGRVNVVNLNQKLI
jgi:hypothetical protein